MKMSVTEALEAVMKDFEQMSPEQFQAEMDKHEDGDIAVAMRELSAFLSWMAITDKGLLQQMYPQPLR